MPRDYSKRHTFEIQRELSLLNFELLYIRDVKKHLSVCRLCGGRCACRLEHGLGKAWGWELRPSFLPLRGKASRLQKGLVSRRYRVQAFPPLDARPVKKQNFNLMICISKLFLICILNSFVFRNTLSMIKMFVWYKNPIKTHNTQLSFFMVHAIFHLYHLYVITKVYYVKFHLYYITYDQINIYES